MTKHYKNPNDSFDAKIAPCPITGCWLWSGSTAGGGKSAGYGYMTIGGKGVYAHRFSYERFKEPIQDGLVINHLCRVRCCVNPDHLEAVSQKENLLAPGSESAAAINASKSRCPKCNGEFVVEYGKRRCCACHKRRNK